MSFGKVVRSSSQPTRKELRMEAKDPAMSPEKIAKHQLLEIIEASKKAGMKEVVKWMGCNSLLEFPHGLKVRSISEALWQAFLKEKGIE